jgi:hypothetical protein
MRDHKKSFANLNRNQSQDNSSTLEANPNNLTHQTPTKGQQANAGPKVTDEGVDVLSLMGFKL